MASNVVECPYCYTKKKVSQNLSYKCSGCGATIFIGNDCEIKKLFMDSNMFLQRMQEQYKREGFITNSAMKERIEHESYWCNLGCISSVSHDNRFNAPSDESFEIDLRSGTIRKVTSVLSGTVGLYSKRVNVEFSSFDEYGKYLRNPKYKLIPISQNNWKNEINAYTRTNCHAYLPYEYNVKECKKTNSVLDSFFMNNNHCYGNGIYLRRVNNQVKLFYIESSRRNEFDFEFNEENIESVLHGDSKDLIACDRVLNEDEICLITSRLFGCAQDITLDFTPKYNFLLNGKSYPYYEDSSTTRSIMTKIAVSGSIKMG